MVSYLDILYLHESLRKYGGSWLRCRYLVEDLEERGHVVHLASYITDKPASKWAEQGLEDDLITVEEVEALEPDVLLIELGALSCGDRVCGREFLDEMKRKGCIVFHCGLDYNEYNRKRDQYNELFRGFGAEIHEGDGWELPNIRGADGGQVARTDVDPLRKYCSIRDPAVFDGIGVIEAHHALVLHPFPSILLVAGPHSRVKAYNEPIHGDANAVFGVYSDSVGVEALITGHFTTDGDSRSDRRDNRSFVINALEHFHKFNPIRYHRRASPLTSSTRVIISYAWQDNVMNADGVGKIDAIVQALRDRKILVDRDIEVFRAGYMPIAEWSKRLPQVDKAVFFYSQAWRDRPNPNKELEAAQREADRRFALQRQAGQEIEPFILFFCLDDAELPDEHSSRLYRRLSGLDFRTAMDTMYTDIVGASGAAKSYDISAYDTFTF